MTRWRMPPRSRCGSWPARRPSTSRWCCPARARTSCSAGTRSTISPAWSGRASGCRTGGAPRSRGRRRYIGNARVFTDDEVARIAAQPGAASPWDVTNPVYDQAEHAGLDDVSTMQLVDINTWLAGDILVKADRMTMAHSLELRVPFLDAEVMKVASRLARAEKIGAGTTKLALRSAMSEVLPKAAAERAKLGFPVPIGHWLTGDSYDFAEQLLREAQTAEWIDRKAALRLLEALRAGEPGVEWRHVWVLIVFSLWHQIFVERAYDPVTLGWERAAR